MGLRPLQHGVATNGNPLGPTSPWVVEPIVPGPWTGGVASAVGSDIRAGCSLQGGMITRQLRIESLDCNRYPLHDWRRRLLRREPIVSYPGYQVGSFLETQCVACPAILPVGPSMLFTHIST